VKGFTLQKEIIENISTSLSPTLNKNEKVEYYI